MKFQRHRCQLLLDPHKEHIASDDMNVLRFSDTSHGPEASLLSTIQAREEKDAPGIFRQSIPSKFEREGTLCMKLVSVE